MKPVSSTPVASKRLIPKSGQSQMTPTFHKKVRMVLEQSKKKKFHENMCVVCEKMSAEKFHEKMCVVRENMCAMEIHEKMCVVVTVIGKKNRNKGLRDGGHRQKMRPKCILQPPPQAARRTTARR